MKCRLCLIECHKENEVSLFSNDIETNLTKLIAKYLYIEVTQEDSFSTIICKDCVRHLNDFHDFFQLVEEQQQVLQKEFHEVKCIANDNGNGSENHDESLLDMKDVLVEGELHPEEKLLIDEFAYADEHLNNDAGSDDEENIPLQCLRRKTANETASNEKKKIPIRKKQLKRSIKRKLRSLKRKNDKESNLKVNDECTKNQYDGVEPTKKLLTPEENKLRDELVTKYIDLKCEICGAQVETYDNLKIHFRKEHKRKAYVTCCNTRFLRRFLLLDHIQTHLNPDRFKCNLCDKILKSKNNLNIHYKNMHAGRDKLKHACKICNKRFQHLSTLNHHMIVHKEERDHICDICKKGFKSSVLLKVHIEHMHGERATFVCETCGKEYRFKLSFDRHVAQHQGDISEPTDKCPICGKWYALKNLRNHIKRHKLEESKCEKCGKTFKSKSALSTHVSYAHGKNIFSCTYCEKTFKRSCALKEHVAMHTGRKDYSCQYCTREFRSKANMYAHTKKIHVEEWAIAKMSKYKCPNENIKNENTVTQEDSFSTIICNYCVLHLNDFHNFFKLIEEQQQVLQKEFHEVKCIVSDNGNGSENNDESLLDMKDVLVEGELHPEKRLLIDEFDDADEHLNNVAGSDEENIPLKSLRRKTANEMASNEKKKRPIWKKQLKSSIKRKLRSLKRKNDKESNLKVNDECTKNQYDGVEPTKKLLTPDIAGSDEENIPLQSNNNNNFFQLVEEQQLVLQKAFQEVKCIVNDVGNGSENHDESLLDMNDVLVEGELHPEERLLIDEFDDADEHMNNVAGSDDEENIPLQCLRRKTANEMASNEKKKRPFRQKQLKSSIKRNLRSLKRKNDKESNLKVNDECTKNQYDGVEPTKKLLTPDIAGSDEENIPLQSNNNNNFFQLVEEQQLVLQKAFQEVKCIVNDVGNGSENHDESLLDMNDVLVEGELHPEKRLLIDEFDDADEHLNNVAGSDEENIPLKSLRRKTANEMASNEKKKRPIRKKQRKSSIKRKLRSLKRKNDKESNLKVNDECTKNQYDGVEPTKKLLTPEENKLLDELVTKYIDLKCEICGAQVETYDNLKIHFRKEHKRKAYVTCCNKRFLRSFLLLDHIQTHLNPDRFKCNLCDKILKSKRYLNIHYQKMHAGLDKLKHACKICNKKFQYLSKLNHHMIVHKEERDHICDICKKGSKSSALLKVHIERIHQGKISEPTDKCPTCGKWYALTSLRNHIKTHKLEESKCEKCGKTFKSKLALSTHVSYAHGKKIFSCTYCKKKFKRSCALKEHIGRHTGQKDYNCKYCRREFRSKANYYAHIKKIHFEEWKKAQLERNIGPSPQVDKKIEEE